MLISAYVKDSFLRRNSRYNCWISGDLLEVLKAETFIDHAQNVLNAHQMTSLLWFMFVLPADD